jgi:hypothetical protein
MANKRRRLCLGSMSCWKSLTEGSRKTGLSVTLGYALVPSDSC